MLFEVKENWPPDYGFNQALTELVALHQADLERAEAKLMETLISFGTSVVGEIQRLHDVPLTGRKNPDDYWKGFTDLAFALDEFIGKQLASASNQRIIYQRLTALRS